MISASVDSNSATGEPGMSTKISSSSWRLRHEHLSLILVPLLMDSGSGTKDLNIGIELSIVGLNGFKLGHKRFGHEH